MKTPCNGHCPDRSPTCHHKCEKYLAFCEKRRKENEERRKAKRLEYLTTYKPKRR